jgi:hypothetical protein
MKNQDQIVPMFYGVVAICTRGAVLTEVLQGVVDNIMGFNLGGVRIQWTIRTTHNLPIPDAQNQATKDALLFQPKYVWYVEEDTVPPPGILLDMIRVDKPVVVADYNLEQGDTAVKLNKKGIVVNAGMGCMLVKSQVLLNMSIEGPWFDDKTWILQEDGGFAASDLKLAGKQDTSFVKRLRDYGIIPCVIPTGQRCRHLRLVGLGERGKNCGLHQIKEL